MFISTDELIIRCPNKIDFKKLLSLYQKKEVMKFIPCSNINWDLDEYSDKSTPLIPDESTPDLVTNNPSYFTTGLY